MKKLIFLCMTLVMGVAVTACSSPAAAEVLMSDKDRIISPDVSGGELQELVEGNTQFAFDLYRKLVEGDENLLYSPYSISLALAMTYAGARSRTADEMASALNFNLPQDRLHPAFNYLDQILAARAEETGEDEAGKGFSLHIANSIWGQKDYQFLEEFLDLLAENYGAGLRVLDFMGDPETSRQTINEWVSQQTEGRIEDLIPEGGISIMTRLVLTNAIYFNASWRAPFDEEDTAPGEFTLADGTAVSVPMMSQTEYFGYGRYNDYLAVELPYLGNKLSMLILTGEGSAFESLQEELGPEFLANILNDMEHTRLDLSMPLFEFESEFNLKEALASLGMQQAFTQSADLSGMNGGGDLLISDVVHKAFISVDESGTEAAAATGVIVGVVSIPPDPVAVSLDSPFIFLIRDIETGAVLFTGRLMDPR